MLDNSLSQAIFFAATRESLPVAGILPYARLRTGPHAKCADSSLNLGLLRSLTAHSMASYLLREPRIASLPWQGAAQSLLPQRADCLAQGVP